MGKRRVKFNDLKRILESFGCEAIPSEGKGSHTKFVCLLADGRFSFPIPKCTDVLPCYVKGVRKKFKLLPSDGVSDDDFFSR